MRNKILCILPILCFCISSQIYAAPRPLIEDTGEGFGMAGLVFFIIFFLISVFSSKD